MILGYQRDNDLLNESLLLFWTIHVQNINTKYNGLTLLETGGVQPPPLLKISSKTLKMASKWPQISWLFLFLYDLSEKPKKIFWFFTVILGV